jgi:branched-chain amino acid transport system permease protein
MTYFFNLVVGGIFTGSFFALLALSYTIIYGVLRLINFANGSLYALGAYIGYSMLVLLRGWPAFLAILAAIVVAAGVCGALSVGIERIAYRPLRQQPVLIMMISALGVAYVIQNTILVIPAWGAPARFYNASIGTGVLQLGGIRTSVGQLVIFMVAVTLLAALTWLTTRTNFGMAIRAIATDQYAARLIGLRINSLMARTFLISGVVTGVTGVLAGLYYHSITYDIGFNAGIVAFTAAVAGGIGNVPGAALGGLLLGVLNSLGTGYLGAEWQDVFAFAALIAVLSFRPQGILGELVAER